MKKDSGTCVGWEMVCGGEGLSSGEAGLGNAGNVGVFALALFLHTCGLAGLSSQERPASDQKVKRRGDLIKSSLQETISISMPNFMQIH